MGAYHLVPKVLSHRCQIPREIPAREAPINTGLNRTRPEEFGVGYIIGLRVFSAPPLGLYYALELFVGRMAFHTPLLGGR